MSTKSREQPELSPCSNPSLLRSQKTKECKKRWTSLNVLAPHSKFTVLTRILWQLGFPYLSLKIEFLMHLRGTTKHSEITIYDKYKYLTCSIGQEVQQNPNLASWHEVDAKYGAPQSDIFSNWCSLHNEPRRTEDVRVRSLSVSVCSPRVCKVNEIASWYSDAYK